MTMREIDALIDVVCSLHRHAVQADPPDGEAALIAYVEARAHVRAAIREYAGKSFNEYRKEYEHD